MGNKSRRARAALALTLLAALGRAMAEGGVGAAPIASALPVEAPASLFQAKLGPGPDDDAELTVSGSWSASILASLDFQAAPGAALALASAQPLLFTQAPDLSLSFLLYKRAFVEARVADDISQAKYSMGYRGGEGEALREARLGNDGISFPSLPFLTFGDGSYRSFGAAALVRSEGFAGRAMVRYDQADRVVKRFVGSTEVVDTVISPNAFIAGTYFMTRSVPGANLALFVQSVAGSYLGSDGGSYRRLDPGEYSYSAITGTLSLAAAVSTRLLAFYPGSGLDPAPANNVTLAGVGPCDLLYVPPPLPATGLLDPKLQILNRYATTASPVTAEAFVRNAASGLRDEAFQARIDPAGFVEVLRLGADAPSAGADYRQPFALPAYADMAWLYTTDFASSAKTGEAPVFTRALVVRSYSTSASITIDKDAVAGSVQVRRDGLPDFSFSLDQEKGILTLAPPPGATEEIVVEYLRQSAERKSGNLSGALGGFWDLGEDWKAWAALGASWALPGSAFASDSQSNPGSINLTAGERDDHGPFTHGAALAARYSRDDATGTYRIEGMESSSDYASSFRQDSSTAGYSYAEILDAELGSGFPAIVSTLHSDGSTQKALKLSAGAGASATATLFKIASAVPYSSFGTFSFFAKLPASAGLSVKLDDGAASPSSSVEIDLLPGSGNGAWRRYILRYGSGDATVYAQDKEGGALTAQTGATSVSPSLTSLGSRLVISVSGLAIGESAWLDELLLEESVGRAALLFQGGAAYVDPAFSFGPAKFPILSGISASASSQAALASTSFASGSATLESTLLFARLKLKARAVAASGSGASLSGGHSIELPSAAFPAALKDEFEFDPSSGAFGRADSLSLRGGSIAALSLSQASAWTPAAAVLDRGMLLQSWEGALSLGGTVASIGLSASNRARPASAPAPGGPGAGYGGAWIGAFGYALPANESESESREVKASLAVKNGAAKDYLTASIGESAEPGAAGGGLRRDFASLRLALPFEAARISFEPYYKRSWKDKRLAAAGGILDDAKGALGDLYTLPVLYLGLPFAELASAGTAADFRAQTAPSGLALPEASLEPEAGLSLAREYGSSWYDFVLPSALSLSYRRGLARAADQVTDTGLWSAAAKFASINLFGSMGAYPLGLPFDSDEYLSTLRATLAAPRGGGASSLDLQYQGLSTLYAGQGDKLDAEGRLALARLPGTTDWSCSLMLSLSRRESRHWLLDLYSLASLGARKDAEARAEGRAGQPSIASQYLMDLAARTPIARTTLGLKGGLSGVQGDAKAPSLGWSVAESYEAKLTLPERLTLKLSASSGQSLDASTRILSLSLELGLGAVISF